MEEVKPKLRALVIDDSRVMRNLVKDSLCKTGLADFDFTEVGDGSEAMSVFDPEKFDILFVDWNMPQLNGLDFARHVRSMRSAKHIPIVMITSESAESKQAKAYSDARITCYITKPFTVEEVRNKLSEVITNITKSQEEVVAKTESSKLVLPPPDSTIRKSAPGFFSRLLGKG